jgi:hypothetical protein
MNRNSAISIETLHILRDTVIGYNDNISQHNRIINSYNTNISNLLNTVHYVLDNDTEPSRVPAQTNRSSNVNQLPRRRTPTMRGSNLSELERINGMPQNTLASLVYLLNIPYPTPSATEQRTILTTQQIINGTQLIRYNDTMGEHRCPISLDDFEPNERICQIRGCNHIFKTVHLMRWFETHNDCPVCRYNLSTEPTTSASSTHSQTIPLPDITRPNLPENDIPTTEIDNIWEIQRTSLDSLDEPRERTPAQTTNASNSLINTRFSQLLSDMILEQLPIMDASNNLLYEIDIPLNR